MRNRLDQEGSCVLLLSYITNASYSRIKRLQLLFTLPTFMHSPLTLFTRFYAGRYAFAALRAGAVRTVDELAAAVAQEWPHATSFRYAQ